MVASLNFLQKNRNHSKLLCLCPENYWGVLCLLKNLQGGPTTSEEGQNNELYCCRCEMMFGASCRLSLDYDEINEYRHEK